LLIRPEHNAALIGQDLYDAADRDETNEVAVADDENKRPWRLSRERYPIDDSSLTLGFDAVAERAGKTVLQRPRLGFDEGSLR
jgi:hypothetical protein